MSPHWLDYVPFLTTAEAPLPEGRRMNWSKLIETLVIAAVTAIAVNYTTTQVLSAKFDDLSYRVHLIEQRLDSMQRDLYYGQAPRQQP